ncbi:small integral membrane protein 15 isoform X1 [Peromyscus californicus insignis]|uniref:small integral membrane protein 15 isoform X1 n=1 Tax=Peromyscus californicus insignis TaxID=564181 RepID=UPI0022A6B718|nr:small integral membrane protein 15 isoform X1 [Peromyscus californicus insignis]
MAARSLRGSTSFLAAALRAECPQSEHLTGSAHSPPPRLPQRPTQDARSRSPTRQRAPTRAQPHLPLPGKLRPAPPRPPAPAMAPPEACPRLPHSRPAPPRLWAGPERSGFRLPPSCLALIHCVELKTSPKYMVKSNSHLNCDWLTDSPRKN